MRILLALLVLLAVTSCVAPPASRPVAPPPRIAPPRPAPTIAALPADWRDWPLTPGNWRYRAVAGGSIATFGPGASGLAAVQCVAARRTVSLIRYAASGGPTLVRTSDLQRQLTFAADGGSVSASLPATDPLLDAIAFSRGRWTIEQPGRPPLVLPAYAEVARVVEDCRN